MKPNTTTVIPISQVTSFLCHPGAVLGRFQDPPAGSFVVEGGWFNGVWYAGVVFTPTKPTIGVERIDTVVANPDTGVIELLAGVEDEGDPPDIPSSPALAPIANVHILTRTNNKVLIEAQDIEDRRSLIKSEPAQAYSMLAHALFNIGRSPPTVGSQYAGGKIEVLAFQNWAATKTPGNRVFGSQNAWVEFKFVGSVSDLHVVASLYNSVLGCVTDGQNNWGSGQGLTWFSLSPGNDGYPRFRVVAMMVNAHGDDGDQERVTYWDSTKSKFKAGEVAQVQIQVWGVPS